MNQRHIWIINHYASTPATGFGGRHHRFLRLAVPGCSGARDKRRTPVWYAFSLSLLVTAWRLGPRIDATVNSPLSLIANLRAELLARFYKGRSIVEARDLGSTQQRFLEPVSPGLAPALFEDNQAVIQGRAAQTNADSVGDWKPQMEKNQQ